MRIVLALFAALTVAGYAQTQPHPDAQHGLLNVRSLTTFEEHPGNDICDQVQGRPSFLSRGHRYERFVLDREGISALTIKSDFPFARLRIVSSEGPASAELCAWAVGGADLDSLELHRSGGALTLSGPPPEPGRAGAMVEVRASVPSDLPVVVDGNYEVEVERVAAPVTIRASEMFPRILETSGEVTADVRTLLTFAGHQGKVRLHSDNEIELRVTAQQFEGTLTADADSMWVVLPDGFTTPFEVQAPAESDFTCHAEWCGRIMHNSSRGYPSLRFGSGEPALHFVAHGPVVIESYEAAARAEEERKEAWQKEQDARQAEIKRANELAAAIHSQDDARQYVDLLWDLLWKELGFEDSELVRREIVGRVAHAEYASAVLGRLVPEEDVADAVNAYMAQIGGPPEAHVTPAEVHEFRAAMLSNARRTWEGKSPLMLKSPPNLRSPWNLPNAFAVDAHGDLAPGCRAVEAAGLVHMLTARTGQFINLETVRARMSRGILGLQMIEEDRKNRDPSGAAASSHQIAAAGQRLQNEVNRAFRTYVVQHEPGAYEKLMRETYERVIR
jgi:hypothetical protein